MNQSQSWHSPGVRHRTASTVALDGCSTSVDMMASRSARVRNASFQLAHERQVAGAACARSHAIVRLIDLLGHSDRCTATLEIEAFDRRTRRGERCNLAAPWIDGEGVEIGVFVTEGVDRFSTALNPAFKPDQHASDKYALGRIDRHASGSLVSRSTSDRQG